MSKVMIIGGGAAGMMAAIAAAYNGNDVTLFEKNEKLGKKIFITGKGRCNVTNASDIENHFKNIINTYKEDYNALATIKSLLGVGKPELSILIPNDNREYVKKSLNDLRNNIERYISPFSIRDSLTMNLDGMINFIKTRLKDDLTIIPWEEVK